MNAERERAEFEAFASKHGLSIAKDDSLWRSHVVSWMWKAWQARATQQSQDREDEERMDWLDKVAHCADWMEDEPTKRVIRAHDGAEFTGDTWREAIDHARRIEGGEDATNN